VNFGPFKVRNNQVQVMVGLAEDLEKSSVESVSAEFLGRDAMVIRVGIS
jgi:hypothetical protein